MDLIRRGATIMFRGARRGAPGLAGLGAAIAAIGWVRRLYRPDRELIWAQNLKPGTGVRVRLLGPEGTDEVEIEG